MDITTSYRVKIKQYNKIFNDTLKVYRSAVDYLIGVCLEKWDDIKDIKGDKARQRKVEIYVHGTKKNIPEYDFDVQFYKLPSYLRRAAISTAVGKVSSYKSNLKNDPHAGLPKAGYCFPAMYLKDMFCFTGENSARIKIRIRNTWDWLDIKLKKTDMDYIRKQKGKMSAPTLEKRGKEWFFRFAFKEEVKLNDKPVFERKALAVDLGVNSPAVCSVMDHEGAVYGRYFLHLPDETDSLERALTRIKEVQRQGIYRMPRLWALAKGANKDIAVKTVKFIMDIAAKHDVDVIVFEHLDLNGKKRGSKKQRLHMWKARDVQNMVALKAHRLGMRISRVNAWGTSKLAFDGSGKVQRGTYFHNGEEKYNYSICVFPTGKTYNCDLNASYNIGARYFIREIINSLPDELTDHIGAKVPQIFRRSTCTLSTLFSLNAELSVCC